MAGLGSLRFAVQVRRPTQAGLILWPVGVGVKAWCMHLTG